MLTLFQEKPGASFAKQANRLVSKARYSSQEALKYSSILFLKSVRARTKKSKTRRRITKQVKGGFIYERYENGVLKYKFLPGTDRAAAKQSKKIIIGRSGLAKLSWGWAMKDLFNMSPGADKGIKRPANAVTTLKTPTMVFIGNKLTYALEALKSGKASLNEAYAASAKALRFRIENALKRAASRRAA